LLNRLKLVVVGTGKTQDSWRGYSMKRIFLFFAAALLCFAALTPLAAQYAAELPRMEQSAALANELSLSWEDNNLETLSITVRGNESVEEKKELLGLLKDMILDIQSANYAQRKLINICANKNILIEIADIEVDGGLYSIGRNRLEISKENVKTLKGANEEKRRSLKQILVHEFIHALQDYTLALDEAQKLPPPDYVNAGVFVEVMAYSLVHVLADPSYYNTPEKVTSLLRGQLALTHSLINRVIKNEGKRFIIDQPVGLILGGCISRLFK
jgi:hypothetical protein